MPGHQKGSFLSIPGTKSLLLNPTPQLEKGVGGGIEEEGGTPRAQVTIYGPLVIVVLSLWPAPSEKWHPLLNPQRAACGTPAVWDRWPSGELKMCCPHHLPFLVLTLGGCPSQGTGDCF